jgi:hypothetical protein
VISGPGSYWSFAMTNPNGDFDGNCGNAPDYTLRFTPAEWRREAPPAVSVR